MYRVKKTAILCDRHMAHVTPARTNITICIKNIFSTLKSFIKYGNKELN
jgi:hypothetical protein